MFSKRIAAAFVGTALAASAVVAPQVTAAPAENSVAVAGYHGKGKCRDHHHKPKQCPTTVKPTTVKPTVTVTATKTTTTTAPAPTETETTSVTATETATETTSITNTKTETATETVGSSIPEGSSEGDDNGAIVGAAAFGLSAIAGSALLLQHFFKPAPAPEGPATGPVAVEDPKAAAQQ